MKALLLEVCKTSSNLMQDSERLTFDKASAFEYFSAAYQPEFYPSQFQYPEWFKRCQEPLAHIAQLSIFYDTRGGTACFHTCSVTENMPYGSGRGQYFE